MSRQKGSTNTGYPRRFTGDLVFDFWESILWMAESDYPIKYRRDGERSKGGNCPDNMWLDFIQTDIYKRRPNVDSLETAWWIASYLTGV